MPIVTITAPTPKNETIVLNLTASVRTLGAKALACEPENIWVVFHGLKDGHYLLGKTSDVGRDFHRAMPFVTIKANEGRTAAQKRAFVVAVTTALGETLGVSAEAIWVHYQELRLQDLWVQGKWGSSQSEGHLCADEGP